MVNRVKSIQGFFYNSAGLIPVLTTTLIILILQKQSLLLVLSSILSAIMTGVIMIFLLFASSKILSFFAKEIFTCIETNEGESALYNIVSFFGDPKRMSKRKLILVAMIIVAIDAVAVLIPVALSSYLI